METARRERSSLELAEWRDDDVEHERPKGGLPADGRASARRSAGGGGGGGGRWGTGNKAQLVVATALTALVGAVVQLAKLAPLDAAGRTYLRHGYADKVAFLAPFGLAKAAANLAVGAAADRAGRRWLATVGFAVGCLSPAVVIAGGEAPEAWPAVVTSGLFLGAQQGLSWTALLLVFVDRMGPRRRGLASGLCEFVGYSATAAFASVYTHLVHDNVVCAWTDSTLDYSRPPECVEATGAHAECHTPDDWVPECVGSCRCTGFVVPTYNLVLTLMVTGLTTSALFLRETLHSHVSQEVVAARPACNGSAAAAAASEEDEKDREDASDDDDKEALYGGSAEPVAYGDQWRTFARTCWSNRSTAVICVAAFATNFMTSLAWGLVLAWARDGLHVQGTSRDFLAGCYSFLKGVPMLLAGSISDRIGRRGPIVLGLAVGAAALLVAACGAGYGGRYLPAGMSAEGRAELQFGYLVLSSALLGLGTGLMYPVLAAAVSDHADPRHRGMALGTMRFWRDAGYVAGVLAGVGADVGSAEDALVASGFMVAAVSLAVAAAYKPPAASFYAALV